MIIKNKKIDSKKISLIALAVIALLVASSLVYVYALKGNLFGWSASHPSNNSKSSTGTSSSPSKNNQSSTNNSSSNNTGSTTTPTKNPETSTQPEVSPSQPSSTQSVNMTIASTNQSASSYHIGVVIYYPTDSGTCTLTMTKAGSATVSQTVGVQALSTSSTCKGFDIPISSLNQGTWHATITFNGSSVNGSTSSDIQVN